MSVPFLLFYYTRLHFDTGFPYDTIVLAFCSTHGFLCTNRFLAFQPTLSQCLGSARFRLMATDISAKAGSDARSLSAEVPRPRILDQSNILIRDARPRSCLDGLFELAHFDLMQCIVHAPRLVQCALIVTKS